MVYNLYRNTPTEKRNAVNDGNNQDLQSGTNASRVAVTGAAPLVQQAAKDNAAINGATAVQPKQSDGSENFFEGGNKAVGRFENTNTVKPAGNTDDKDNADNLSSALSGSNTGAATSPKAEFHKDEGKKDGGFFKWVKSLLPKNRAGQKEGESDDDYDRRITRNNQMVATFADAIRHIGNIVNTSKGAPAQKFNDPNSALEQGYEKRKKERAAKDALQADAAYKTASLKLKERAAEADRVYKQYLAMMNNRKFAYQQAKDKAEADRQAANAKQKQDNWNASFEERKRHNKASETISASKGKGKGGSGKSGSTGKYRLYNKNTGQYEYFQNEGSRNQRAAELGYDLTPGIRRSKSTENITANGTVKKTDHQGGLSVSASLGKQEAAAKAANARKAQQQKEAAKKRAQSAKVPGKENSKSKNGYANTKKLGL